jgi:hypothetical protein
VGDEDVGQCESVELRDLAWAVERLAATIDELMQLRRGRLNLRRERVTTPAGIAAAQGIAEDVAELAQQLEREAATIREFVDLHRTA